MPAYKNSISSRIWFTKDFEWQSTNVLADVKAKAASEEGKIAKFQLVASSKDGYTAEIHTRETEEFCPYVEALVDGSYRKFYAKYDTYTFGCEPSIIQGHKETMYVEESVSSIEAFGEKDEYTKVSFMQFDFEGLTPNNKITEARLYLHGRMFESESPGGVRIPSDKKSVFLMPFIRGETELDEEMTYSTYSGYTNDYTLWDGEMSPEYHVNPNTGIQSNNYVIMMTRYLSAASNGYAFTRDETFGWHCMRILMGLIRNVGDYDDMVYTDTRPGSGIDGTFYVGQTGTELPNLMKDFIHSECMTPEILSALIKHIWQMTKLVVEDWCDQDEGHNWGTYSTRGLVSFTMYFPEFRDSHGPTEGLLDPTLPGSMQGGWTEVAKYRIGYKVGDVIYENGASVEVSIEYGTEALVNLLFALSEADRTNADASDYFSEELVKRLADNAYFLLGHTNPWYGDWQIGDGSSYSENYPSRVKRILDLTDDQQLEYLVSAGTRGETPDYLAVIHDNVGKVTLRNSWNKNAVAAHLEGSGGLGTHGHNDDLSITLAAYGEYLLIDPRMGFYGIGEPNECWLSSTRGHNTVIINDTIGTGDKNYRLADGLDAVMDENGVLTGYDVVGQLTHYPNSQKTNTPVNFNPDNREINDVYDFVRGETFAYTNNNAMKSDYQVIRDTLFMHKGYFIVTDYLNPENDEESNKYEQMWHMFPSANISIDPKTNVVRSNNDNAANVAIATVNADENTLLTLEPGIVAFGKGNNVDAEYANFEKNAVGTTTFNTIIYPMTPSEDVTIFTEKLDLNVAEDVANAFKAQVLEQKSGTTTDISYYTLFEENEKASRTFGDYVTDGTLALAEKGAEGYGAAVIRDAKVLEDTTTDSYIVYSNKEISDLGIVWQENSIDLSSTKADEIDITNLTVVANNEVDTVRLNGEKISFKQEGKYVYFGLKAIIEDDTKLDEEEEEKEEVKNPVHGGSSGGKGSGSSGGGKGSGSSGGGISLGGGTALGGTTNTNKEFKDAQGHWAEDYIKKAVESGIVKGDDKGNFNPEKPVTRAELISMVVRALGDAEEVGIDNTFSDVKDSDWFAKDISKALKLGIISPDIWFRPNDKVTREEMCKIIVGFAEKMGITGEISDISGFKDNNDMSAWAKPFAQKAIGYGLMQGMDENSFGGKFSANRAQAVTVIQRALDRK